ncbi:MAG: hypothetical protein BM565_11695 [Gammaproteobacteria bacterium MedPE]|nr:MAG: hypothetical protein BM565_11695 [Gammaproteobacteria bacterium MedPE]
MINLGLLLLSCYMIYRANIVHALKQLNQSRVALHLYAGTTLTLTLLASLTGGISTQMPLHFMGLAAAALIIGYRLTISAALIVVFILLALGKIPVEHVGISLTAGYLIPLVLFQIWIKVTKSHNIWIFSFVTAGIGSLVLFIIKTLCMASYYYWGLNVDPEMVVSQYMMISPLFWIPELLLSVTVLITCLQHRPQWVACYQPSSP